MADLYLERIGLTNQTIVERDNNGKIERLESVGLDMASLVAFWRRCFDLDELFFEKITLHCKSKDFNAMGGRVMAQCRSVRELLAEHGVECVVDDEWFKNREVKNEAVILTPKERGKELKVYNEKQVELEAEIERLKADNEALTMWNNVSAETIQKLSETNKRLASNMKSVLEIEKKNAVKEFAEKLKKKLFDFFQKNEELDCKISLGSLYVDVIGVEAEDGTIISLGLIDKLLKEQK